MHTLLQDLRYSARQLIKSPGFTLTAVISLALGIGAATAVFSVIYAVLMHPYPYPATDRIVRLTVDSVAGPGDPVYLNGAEIQTLRQSPVVESVLASDNSALMLTGQDLPETVHAVSLISNNFEDLGVPALLGRGLWPSDALDGQDPRPVAVLSYRFWRRHYLSNPDVVGRTLQLDHRNFEIVRARLPDMLPDSRHAKAPELRLRIFALPQTIDARWVPSHLHALSSTNGWRDPARPRR